MALVIDATASSGAMALGVYGAPNGRLDTFLEVLGSMVALGLPQTVARLVAGGLLVFVAWLLQGWPLRRQFAVVVVAAVGIGALLIWLAAPFIGWREPGVHFSVLYVALVVGLLLWVELRRRRELVVDE